MIFRGVNRSGLEYSQAAIPESDLDEIAAWGANLIRLPFNQHWVLTDPAYLATLDDVIEAAAARGLCTLLDLHWLDNVTVRGTSKSKPNFVPPLPNLDSIEIWSRLAARYRDKPAVLYDIFNEPHDPLPGDPLLSDRVGFREWQPWAIQLVNAIRSQHPDAVIFVPGIQWASDLSGFPIPGLQNVVYSAHLYPWNTNPADLPRLLDPLVASASVFIGEWGGEATDAHYAWGTAVASYIDSRNLGFAAWSWSDWPHLVGPPPQPPYRPTRFGALVKELLAVQP